VPNITSVIYRAEYVPADPVQTAELTLDSGSYSGPENTVISFNILRGVFTGDRMSIDWAITNATVTPNAGTVIFEVGDTTKLVQVTAGEVGPTEIGQLTLTNQINLDGGDPPILEVPFTASFTVVDTDTGSDTPDYPDPLIGVTLLGGRQTVNVNGDGELAAALTGAVAGQTIKLAAGVYTNAHTINKTAAINNPIIIEGADNFGSTVSNQWTVDGAYIYTTGILFDGPLVNFNFYGNTNKIIGNKFTGWGDLTIGSRYAITARLSTFNEIAYNEFYEHGPFKQDSYDNHPIYGGDGSVNNSLRIAIRTSESSTGVNMPTDTWVHHNLFRDFPDKPRPSSYSSGQNDALEWGETVRPFTPNFSTRLYFESNMILRCLSGQGGPGVGFVDLKTGGGSVCRYNTWKESTNRLAQRGPTVEGVTFESNHFDATDGAGSTIHGCNNRVIGNVSLGGAGHLLVAGSENALCGEVPPNNGHATCNNAVVAGNQGALTVGVNYGAGPYGPVTNTLIEQHTGSISLQNHSGTTDKRNDLTTTCAGIR
jgi:hypothetical protein